LGSLYFSAKQASCKIAFRLIVCVRARLQSCRKWLIKIPALAAAKLQNAENKAAGAKAQPDFTALPARLKSCPDALCSFNGILQEVRTRKTSGKTTG
jgi:hypothetical protein